MNIKSNKKTRVNLDIRAKEVRLIDPEGEQLGIVGITDALDKAKTCALDLVEIAPNASPPVCRIMDFGKFQFEQTKKRAAQRKKQKQTKVKELKFRPTTDIGDYDVKLNKLRHFLEEGDKVKVTVRFRGREMQHQDLGMDLLDRIELDVGEKGVVEMRPKLEGRQMTMVIAPKRG